MGNSAGPLTDWSKWIQKLPALRDVACEGCMKVLEERERAERKRVWDRLPQILGIGTDGHIAFNEPASSLRSRTRVEKLTEQTRLDNARFFDDDVDQVPWHCLTQGLGTILDARHLVLIATGHHKAEAVHQMVEGAVSAMWPATVLQLHQHASVLLDDRAASRLQLADYHRMVWRKRLEGMGL